MTNVPASFLTAQMSKFTFTEPIQVLLVFALGGGGGVLDISLDGEVRPGLSYPDPV